MGIKTNTLETTSTANDSIKTAGGATIEKRVIIDDTTEATTTTDGSVATAGGGSFAKNVVVGGAIIQDANIGDSKFIKGQYSKAITNNTKTNLFKISPTNASQNYVTVKYTYGVGAGMSTSAFESGEIGINFVRFSAAGGGVLQIDTIDVINVNNFSVGDRTFTVTWAADNSSEDLVVAVTGVDSSSINGTITYEVTNMSVANSVLTIL